MPKRTLTKLEKQFVEEAEKGHFLVDYEGDGTPYALGAPATDNLFTVEVEETPDGPDDSIYRLLETSNE